MAFTIDTQIPIWRLKAGDQEFKGNGSFQRQRAALFDENDDGKITLRELGYEQVDQVGHPAFERQNRIAKEVMATYERNPIADAIAATYGGTKLALHFLWGALNK